MNNDYAFLTQFITEPIFIGKESVININGDTTPAPQVIQTPAVKTVTQEAPTTTVAGTPVLTTALPKVTVNFSGKNTDSCLILTHYPTEDYISIAGKELISKMLGAIGKTLDNFAVINIAKLTEGDITFPLFNKVVIFGDLAAQIGSLEGTPLIITTKNKVESGKGKKFLWTYTLEELGSQDNVGKKAFWDAFKLVVS